MRCVTWKIQNSFQRSKYLVYFEKEKGGRLRHYSLEREWNASQSASLKLLHRLEQRVWQYSACNRDLTPYNFHAFGKYCCRTLTTRSRTYSYFQAIDLERLVKRFGKCLQQLPVAEIVKHGSERCRLFQTLEINRQQEILSFNFILICLSLVIMYQL